MDNEGARIMASIITTMSCTKYVGIRYKYVNEYVEDVVAKMIFLSLRKMTVTHTKKT